MRETISIVTATHFNVREKPLVVTATHFNERETISTSHCNTYTSIKHSKWTY